MYCAMCEGRDIDQIPGCKTFSELYKRIHTSGEAVAQPLASPCVTRSVRTPGLLSPPNEAVVDMHIQGQRKVVSVHEEPRI